MNFVLWLIFLMIRDVSTSTLLTTCSFTEFDISRFANRLRYHVSFQVSVCIWLLCQSELVYLKHVCLKTLSVVWSFVGRRGADCGPPTAFPRTGPRVPWVSALTHGVSQSPRMPCDKEPTLVCVGWSRYVLRSVRTCSEVVSHAHVQLRTLTYFISLYFLSRVRFLNTLLRWRQRQRTFEQKGTINIKRTRMIEVQS